MDFMKTSTPVTHAAFDTIRLSVCEKLKDLDVHLTYHNLEHTLDVMQQCGRLAAEEGATDPHAIYLLKVAAMYHDTGFLRTYRNHEEQGCQIFLEDADAYGFSEEDKVFVKRLIMATKLPQTPHDLYERIICDADLDYLGRSDFFTIGDGLRREFLHFGVVDSDEAWGVLQIKFLTSHSYHTKSSQRLREPVKQQHLAQLH